jgi:hypothetical protein
VCAVFFASAASTIKKPRHLDFQGSPVSGLVSG